MITSARCEELFVKLFGFHAGVFRGDLSAPVQLILKLIIFYVAHPHNVFSITS